MRSQWDFPFILELKIFTFMQYFKLRGNFENLWLCPLVFIVIKDFTTPIIRDRTSFFVDCSVFYAGLLIEYNDRENSILL